MNFEDSNFADLVKKLRDDTTTLVKEEVALAKTELSGTAARLSRHALTIVVGGLLAHAALVLLLLSIAGVVTILLKSTGISPETSTCLGLLVVALAFGAVAASMTLAGLNAFKQERLIPRKTIQSLKQDKQLIKNNLP